MSEMQRDDDAGAVLRLLPHFLRLEMHQLRRDHRSHDFQQSKKEPGCAGQSTGVCQLTAQPFIRFHPIRLGSRILPSDRVAHPLRIWCAESIAVS